eukprot:jgi/Mesen1/4441/ME000225S03429
MGTLSPDGANELQRSSTFSSYEVAHETNQVEKDLEMTRLGGKRMPKSHALMAKLPSRHLLSTAAAATLCTGVVCGVNSACKVVNGVVNGAAKCQCRGGYVTQGKRCVVNVVDASKFKKAIAAATANDVIIIRASFNVSSTIKIEKSLRFQTSVSGVTIGFTGASPPLTTYGIRVFGTSKLKVSFRGLTFDGFNIDRTLVHHLTLSLLIALYSNLYMASSVQKVFCHFSCVKEWTGATWMITWHPKAHIKHAARLPDARGGREMLKRMCLPCTCVKHMCTLCVQLYVCVCVCVCVHARVRRARVVCACMRVRVRVRGGQG